MTVRPNGPEDGASRVEVLVLVLLACLVAGVGGFAVLRREAREERVHQIDVSRAALVDAAIAAERFASGRDGFYGGLRGKTQDFLEGFGFETPPRVSISILEASPDTYCVRATNGAMAADEWRTATYNSTDQTITSRDSCR